MLITDLQQALQRVLRRPGFLLMGALALGMGLAGTSLVFALLNTFVLRPVPGLHPTAPLLELGRVSNNSGFDSFSYPDFVDIRNNSASLDRVFAHRTAPAYLQHGVGTELAQAMLVSGDYFDTLGTQASLGQLLGRQHDGAPGASPLVVASQAAFERWLGADPTAIGRTITLNGSAYTLIGVTAPDFRGHDAVFSPDFYLPLSMQQAMNLQSNEIFEQRGSRWLQLGARLAPGATLEQARAELAALALQTAQAYPLSNREVSFDAALLRATPVEARRLIGMIAAALLTLCAAVVALASINLGGVMLARGQARQSELAMRSALGAARMRLVRLLLFEALIVGGVAGLLGLLLTWMARGILNAMPLPLPIALDLSLAVDAPVVVASMATALLVALGFGLFPALRISASAPGQGTALREDAAGRIVRQRGRHLLIALQATLTVALLLVAGLVMRAVTEAKEVDPGFRVADVYYMDVDLEPLGIDSAMGSQRMDELAEQLRAQAGIDAAGYASVVPLTLSSLGFGGARVAGQQGEGIRLDVNTVGAGFLEALEVPVRGRSIQRSDVEGSERVAVINQELAQRLFGDDDPLGRRIEMGGRDDWDAITIVGVVPNGKYSSLSDSGKTFAYLAAPQWRRSSFTMFVRSALAPEQLRERIAMPLQQLFPGLPLPRVHAFSDAAQVSILPQIVLGFAATALGTLALILAAIGIYGVLAFQVAQRTREFGLRMALGAPGVRIASHLVRRLLLWLLPGAALGLLLGVAGASALGSMLFGIAVFDPLMMSMVLLLFLLMVVLSVSAPLRRALRLNPNDALRHD